MVGDAVDGGGQLPEEREDEGEPGEGREQRADGVLLVEEENGAVGGVAVLVSEGEQHEHVLQEVHEEAQLLPQLPAAHEQPDQGDREQVAPQSVFLGHFFHEGLALERDGLGLHEVLVRRAQRVEEVFLLLRGQALQRGQLRKVRHQDARALVRHFHRAAVSLQKARPL